MEPLIYQINNANFKTTSLKIDFDNNPSPKLIKYGFNTINEYLNLFQILSNPHYQDIMHFNFSRSDNKSLVSRGKKEFGLKNFDINFAEFWELLNMFNLLDKPQSISSTHSETIKDIITVYKKSTNSKNKLIQEDKNASIIIYKYADTDIDENTSIQLLINYLPKILASQAKAGNLILQLFSTQTQIIAEIIYYLSSIYRYAYLVKPSVTSELSDSKYLVLLDLHTTPQFIVPKHSKDVYLYSIGQIDLPNELTTSIQCMNAETIPLKYHKYIQVKTYLATKIFEGEIYQKLLNNQNDNTEMWIKVFNDLPKLKSMVDKIIQDSDNQCQMFLKLDEII